MRKLLINRRLFLALCGSGALGAIALAQGRYATFSPFKGRSHRLNESDDILMHQKDRLVFDLELGFIQALSNSLVDLPILRSQGGGNQTVIRIVTGKIFANFRKLTHPASILKIVNYSQKLALVSIGTKFCVSAQGKDLLIAGVDEGKVSATSGGVTVPFIGGQGVVLEDGKPPVIFAIDYVMEVEGIKATPYLGRENIVTGTVALGNTVEVDEGVVVMAGRSFRAVTPNDSVRVINASGNQKRFYFPGVRPFFGS